MTRRLEGIALAALLAPWGLAAWLLPLPLRVAAWLGLLGVAIVALLAAAWSRQRAEALGIDAERWALLAVMTLGVSTIMLTSKPAPSRGATFLCDGCGRIGALHEPFCFGCGAVA